MKHINVASIYPGKPCVCYEKNRPYVYRLLFVESIIRYVKHVRPVFVIVITSLLTAFAIRQCSAIHQTNAARCQIASGLQQ